MPRLAEKFLCGCLPIREVNSRRNARSKVRVLGRKLHRNNDGVSCSGVEESVTITRHGSLAIYSISGTEHDVSPEAPNRRVSNPETLRDRVELPGAVNESVDERAVEKKKPTYKMADGTKPLPEDALMNLPQPTRSYVMNVRSRRLMKEFKAVSKIAEGAEVSGGDLPQTSGGHVSDKAGTGPDTSCSGKAKRFSLKNKRSDKGQSGDSDSSKNSESSKPDRTGSACSRSISTKDSSKGGSDKRDLAGAAAVEKAMRGGGFMKPEVLSGPPYAVELANDNLAEWNIKLFHINPASSLAQDMKKHNVDHILFNMSFPENFPFAPPFVRVVNPRIEYGFVLDGGAICMELLTPQGWSSAYTIDAVIMQLGATLIAGDGRIVPSGIPFEVPFSKHEAQMSFRSIVETHERYGWHKAAGDNS